MHAFHTNEASLHSVASQCADRGVKIIIALEPHHEIKHTVTMYIYADEGKEGEHSSIHSMTVIAL